MELTCWCFRKPRWCFDFGIQRSLLAFLRTCYTSIRTCSKKKQKKDMLIMHSKYSSKESSLRNLISTLDFTNIWCTNSRLTSLQQYCLLSTKQTHHQQARNTSCTPAQPNSPLQTGKKRKAAHIPLIITTPHLLLTYSALITPHPHIHPTNAHPTSPPNMHHDPPPTEPTTHPTPSTSLTHPVLSTSTVYLYPLPLPSILYPLPSRHRRIANPGTTKAGRDDAAVPSLSVGLPRVRWGWDAPAPCFGCGGGGEISA